MATCRHVGALVSVTSSLVGWVSLQRARALCFAAGGFKRPFTEYIKRLEGYLGYDMPKILYCESKYKDQVGLVLSSFQRLFLAF